MAKDEPQSYGSQEQWVKGKTGQEVNRQVKRPAPHPNSQHGDFGAPDQGGKVSPEQLADNAQPQSGSVEEDQPVTKVTDKTAGAKRGGYFRKRDYGS